ncbi:MAG TPA: hypothetical protein PKN04_01855 [bacterium]|nr:hypothetical protein [bacterium]HNT64504.1 hypothetical protein [bacterium]HOX84651.1 hypothetical protein [bacterium]HPG45374.1 hypothetical protein [bacterium]HPM96850.1 hypothetical protein [bacterium]
MNTICRIWIGILLMVALNFGAEWSEPILPLEQVKAGMTGTGLTVYSGTAVESFDFQVLGILENLYPRFDVILVRLQGEQAEKSGVASGMSGSPMYIDGRLIGALAMRFGQFMKEPIGAVMPIESMLQLLEYQELPRQRVGAGSGWLQPYLRTVLCGAETGFWAEVVQRLAGSAVTGSSAFQPIPVPLVFSGVQADVISEFHPLFQRLGFHVMAGGATARGNGTSSISLQPGSAVAQLFVDGDISISAIGTVTGVHDGRVLAFGHQIFNLGPIRLPLAHATILATMPSLMGSSKMALTSETVGSFCQDRLSGAVGTLGVYPELIPVELLVRHGDAPDQLFKFSMADDQALNNVTPFFLRIALYQALIAARLASEPVTTRFTAEFQLANGERLELEELYSTVQEIGMLETGSDVANASDLVAGVLGVILVNDFESPQIKHVKLRAESCPGEQLLHLKAVRQNRKEIAPGDTLCLWMTLQKRREKEEVLQQLIPIPERIDSDELQIIVSSGSALTRYEVQTTPQKFQPYDWDHLLSIVRNRRRNDRLYIQVRVKDSGLYLQGEELTALPLSILEIMDSPAETGIARKTANRVLCEYEIATDSQVHGAKQLQVRIERPTRASQSASEAKKTAIVY